MEVSGQPREVQTYLKLDDYFIIPNPHLLTTYYFPSDSTFNKTYSWKILCNHRISHIFQRI